MSGLMILTGFVLIICLWAVVIYNRLIALKNQILNGWAQIDVQLKRRYDLIPNLVESVRGYMQHEKTVLESVIAARARAMATPQIAQKAVTEEALSALLKQVFVLVENYPALKANEGVAKLQEELIATENRIGFARQFYNDMVSRFNIAQQSFPANLLVGMFGFRPAEFFGLKDDSQRNCPVVDLSRGPRT